MNGAAVGEEFQAHTETYSQQYDPTVAASADGGFVVAWSSYEVYQQPSSGFSVDYNILGQKFHADGSTSLFGSSAKAFALLPNSDVDPSA